MTRPANRIEDAINKIILKYYPTMFGVLFFVAWCIAATVSNISETDLALVITLFVFIGIMIWVSQNIREYNNAKR